MKAKNFNIEDNIPCPEKGKSNHLSKWRNLPLTTMQPNQSVILETCKNEASNRRFRSIYASVYGYMKNTGVDAKKYKIGMVPSREGGKSDIRLWRKPE